MLARSLAATYYGGHHVERHSHKWGQLIYAASGVMRIEADGAVWIVPPARAVWVPEAVSHEIFARGEFAMRSVYIPPGQASVLPGCCSGIEVTPLLRELILRIVELGVLETENREHRALFELCLIRLEAAERLPTRLALPRDRRGRYAAERLMAEPSVAISLPELARISGASARTLQRIFLEETGLGFGEWRQCVRLTHAASLLSPTVSVTEAGLAAGYGSTSAFVAAFGRLFGCTPAAFRARPFQRTGGT
jgi:AraC-like DNA-binding protein